MMGKIIEMLPLMLLGFSCLPTVECGLSWLQYLPDSERINTLAFIGTHDTATYGTVIPFAQTQSIPITEQLHAGIRVFDMRVRRTSNVFAMHHDLIFLGMMFGDLVRDVHTYLQDHPKEFVIMLMQEEYTAESSTMSECEILENKYIKDLPNLFVKHWSIEDTIGQHRGKILLARANRGFWLCITQLPCDEQNRWELNSQYGPVEKWNDIRAFQAKVSATTHDDQCYINYLSAHGGALFTPESIALDWLLLPGFPRIEYNDMMPGMNKLMAEIFHNPRNTLYIIMADYPTLMLIIRVIDSNIEDIVGPTYFE